MGYRSDVIFGVRKKHEKKIQKVLEKHDLLKYIDRLERNHSYNQDGKLINDLWVIYSASSIKWYDYFDEVIDIHNVIDKLVKCDDDGDGDGFCVALGEEGETHSESGYYWQYVDVIRKIEVI